MTEASQQPLRSFVRCAGKVQPAGPCAAPVSANRLLRHPVHPSSYHSHHSSHASLAPSPITLTLLFHPDIAIARYRPLPSFAIAHCTLLAGPRRQQLPRPSARRNSVRVATQRKRRALLTHDTHHHRSLPRRGSHGLVTLSDLYRLLTTHASKHCPNIPTQHDTSPHRTLHDPAETSCERRNACLGRTSTSQPRPLHHSIHHRASRLASTASPASAGRH